MLAVVLTLALAAGNARAASSSITPTLDAMALGRALAQDAGTVTAAEFVARPFGGTTTAVSDVPLAGFPVAGNDYTIVSTGDPTLAATPNTSSSTGVDQQGGNVRGDTDFDVTILRVDLDVPSTANCLAGIDFRFFSEEHPEFVGSPYNDAFIIGLDKHSWTTSGSEISAPENFAFDPEGNVISVNAAGVTSMTAAEAAGTTYDAATPLLTAATPITPGHHRLFLSIFDQGDHVLDSAVFLDNLRFSHVADVAEDCKPGAGLADPSSYHRLLQFNMCGSAGGAPPKKPNPRCDPEGVAEAVARTVRELHPTIVTLNEVCRSQLTDLEELLVKQGALSETDQGPWAMTSAFAATNTTKSRCSDRQFGNAVLVRGPVQVDTASPYPLDQGPGGKGKARGKGAERRSMVCLTSVATSVPVHACSVHVADKPRNEIRDQIFEVARIGLSWVSEGDAAVIGGDFNATPEDLSAFEDEEVSGGLSRFLLEFTDVDFADDEPTHERYGKIDYIFLSVRHFSDIEGFPTSSEYSDHHPLRGSAMLSV